MANPFALITKPFGCLISLISGIVTLVLVVLLVLWLGFSFIITPAIKSHAEEATDLTVALDGSHFNPFATAVTLEDLRIRNPEGLPKTDMVHLREGVLDGNWTNTYQDGTVTLDVMTLNFERLSLLSAGGASNLEILRSKLDAWLTGSDGNLQIIGKPLVIKELTVSIRTVSEGNATASGIETKQFPISYTRTFNDVTQWQPVIRAVASDLRSQGRLKLAGALDPIAGDDGKVETNAILRRILEGLQNR